MIIPGIVASSIIESSIGWDLSSLSNRVDINVGTLTNENNHSGNVGWNASRNQWTLITGRVLKTFSVSTPNDLTTITSTLVASLTFGSSGDEVRSAKWIQNGTQLYVSYRRSSDNNFRIAIYDCSTAYSLTTASLNTTALLIGSTPTLGIAASIVNSGQSIVAIDDAADEFYSWPLSTPYDISTIGSRTDTALPTAYAFADEVIVNQDGSKVAACVTSKIIQYDISSFNFTALSNEQDVVTSIGNSQGIYVDEDNQYLYIKDGVGDFTIRYDI